MQNSPIQKIVKMLSPVNEMSISSCFLDCKIVITQQHNGYTTQRPKNINGSLPVLLTITI